jgi:multisubunit Na+/H+ antiporter MnhB subunit
MTSFIAIIIGSSVIIGLIAIFGAWPYDSKHESLLELAMDDEFKRKWLRTFTLIWVGVLVCFAAISLIVFGVTSSAS